MKIHPHHAKRIAHTIVALNVAAERTDDAKQKELLADAAFYLMELAVKNTWPQAQSLIETTQPKGECQWPERSL